MKKNVLFFSVIFTLLLAGCFETTDEVTLKKDGSGVMTSTNDMSMLISMAKGMGGANAMGDEKPTDTIVSLAKMADSLTSLTDEEKDLVRNGKLGLTINMTDEKMITRLEIPFAKLEQIDKIKGISSKITNYFLGKNMGDNMPPGLGDKMPSSDPIGDYYFTTYSQGVIEKKLNKEKYAGLESDEIMKGIKEIADNGMPMSNTIIINLPSPAKSITGKGATLSEDKKKVTIKSTAEDFFDNAAGLEFKIEY
ncbi:MAG: hypothetical protein JNN00_12565 [Chitinophagaceae bacterium]|nr:hypothetical protein [Chitinophagaceae bacterium]